MFVKCCPSNLLKEILSTLLKLIFKAGKQTFEWKYPETIYRYLKTSFPNILVQVNMSGQHLSCYNYPWAKKLCLFQLLLFWFCPMVMFFQGTFCQQTFVLVTLYHSYVYMYHQVMKDSSEKLQIYTFYQIKFCFCYMVPRLTVTK